MTRRAIWLPLGLIAGVAVALMGLVSTGQNTVDAQAPIIVVTMGDATMDVGGQATANITLSITGGDVGALEFDVTYDDTLASVDPDPNTPPPADGTAGCATAFGVCNPGTPPTVIFALASVTGITSGTVGSINFTGVALGSGPLTLTINTCANLDGTIDHLANGDCTAVNGTLTIQAPTPTPTPPPATPTPTPTPVGQTPSPSPTPIGQTASPSPTPAGLPPTGGDSSSSALPLFLAAMGVVVVTAGAWAVTRLRRVQA